MAKRITSLSNELGRRISFADETSMPELMGYNGDVKSIYNVGGIRKKNSTSRGPSSPKGGAQKESGVLNTRIPQSKDKSNYNNVTNSDTKNSIGTESFDERVKRYAGLNNDDNI